MINEFKSAIVWWLNSVLLCVTIWLLISVISFTKDVKEIHKAQDHTLMAIEDSTKHIINKLDNTTCESK